MKARTVQLGEVCEFIRGVTFDKADATTRPEHGKTPILRAGNIGEELDAQNDLVWVPDAQVADEQRLRRNDIAICMSSGSPEVVGKTARVPSNLRASIGSFCGIIRPKNPDEASYLSFFFRSPAFRKHRDAIARGANIQNLRFSQFEEIRLEIPEEQRRIAQRLEQADRLRRTRRYALQLTDTYLPATFLKLFGDPLRGKHNWPEVRFDELIRRITYGFTCPMKHLSEGIPILTAKNVLDGRIDFQKVHYAEKAEFAALTAKCKPQRNDILITKDGTIGRCAVVDVNFPICINQSVALVQPKLDIVMPVYLANYILFPSVNAFLNGMGKGVALVHLQITQLAQMPIPLPPLPLQQKFAALVERVERLRAVQRESLRQAEHLFASLLHHTFSA